MRELQSGNGRRLEWLGWIPGGVEEEKRLHAAMITWSPESRATGEWFHVTGEIVEKVLDICGDHEGALLLAQLADSLAILEWAHKAHGVSE